MTSYRKVLQVFPAPPLANHGPSASFSGPLLYFIPGNNVLCVGSLVSIYLSLYHHQSSITPPFVHSLTPSKYSSVSLGICKLCFVSDFLILGTFGIQQYIFYKLIC